MYKCRRKYYNARTVGNFFRDVLDYQSKMESGGPKSAHAVEVVDLDQAFLDQTQENAAVGEEKDMADRTHDAVKKLCDGLVRKFRQGSDCGKVFFEISNFTATFEKDSFKSKELGMKLNTAEATIHELTERLEKRTADLADQTRSVQILKDRNDKQVLQKKLLACRKYYIGFLFRISTIR